MIRFNSLWVIPFHCIKNRPVLDDVLLLCKRLDFQVKELVMMPKYRQDDAVKLRVKKLAFIRVSDVVATFDSLPTTPCLLRKHVERTIGGGDSFKPSVQDLLY